MKSTVSTLSALYMALPFAFAIKLAQPLTISVESTLNSGTITIFPDGSPIKVRHAEGEYPQPIGALYFTEIGEDNAGRFDLIDNGQASGSYDKCLIWLLKDPMIDALPVQVSGPLADLNVSSPGLPDGIMKVECNWLKNGEQ